MRAYTGAESELFSSASLLHDVHTISSIDLGLVDPSSTRDRTKSASLTFVLCDSPRIPGMLQAEKRENTRVETVIAEEREKRPGGKHV